MVSTLELFSPVERLQIRTNIAGAMARAVAEMRGVPEDDVAVLDDFAVDEPIEIRPRQRRVRRESLAIVVLGGSAIAENPDVADAIRIARAVVRSRDEPIAVAGGERADSPLAVPRGVARPANLVPLRVQLDPPMIGGWLNSSTTLLPAVRMSKSNRQ